MTSTSEKEFTKDKKNHVTVASFSLTHEAKDALEKALKPYVNQGKELQEGEDDQKIETLARVVSKALGKSIIQELQNLNEKDTENQTVYVIHNLPELPEQQLKQKFQATSNHLQSDAVLPKTYSYFLMKGLARAVSLEFDTGEYASNVRRRNDKKLAGGEYHNHDSFVASAMMGLVSDGAPTTFLNLRDLANHADAGKVEVKERQERTRTVTMQPKKLSDYTHANPKDDIEIDDENAHQNLLKQYSKDVFAKHGDLVLWAEKGKLVHRAVPARENNEVQPSAEIVRVVGVYLLSDQQSHAR